MTEQKAFEQVRDIEQRAEALFSTGDLTQEALEGFLAEAGAVLEQTNLEDYQRDDALSTLIGLGKPDWN